MRYRIAITIAAAALLIACKSGAVRDDLPAHITAPDARSRAELLRVVGIALNARTITIADDALVNDSLLIIEPKYLTGRELSTPEHFRLVLNGTRCILVHQENESRTELRNTSCAAE